MTIETLIWFGISGGALIFAGSLLHARFIRRDPNAVRSKGAFTMFAVLMVLFAAGAAAAGLAAAQ